MNDSAGEPRGSILVVDDEPLNLRAMEALLSEADWQVVTASSGREALWRILRADFALILLDVRMPEMDGFETAALIRRLKRSRYTPIVFLTAAGEHPDWVQRGYEAGGVDFIVKPVDPEVLRTKVGVFIDLNSRNASLATEVARQKTAQRALSKAKDDLEIKVRERTASLISAHDRLRQEIQQRERAEAELLVAKRVAEEANRAKSQFLANMSHEIRTPMNAIIGLTEVALETELTAEQRECLDLVRASGESLLAIVNDILDISKIEAGRIAVEAIPFLLRECVGDAMRPLAVTASNKDLEFSWEIAPQTPPALLGDPLRLRQVLLNLVGNAIKFTDAGSVTLRVRPETFSAGEVCCHFSVEDTGIGIPLQQQGMVFAPFRQGAASTARRYGGTGLGLAISARLVELMGGRIWVESTPGTGSTFHFTVSFGVADRAPAPAARAAARNGAPEGEPAKRMTVLLVEDNVVNRRLAEIALIRRGHTVVAVDNGRAAVDTARARRFDLILMDVQLPGMDGIDATRAIRAAEQQSGGHVPIVALTAHALAGVREQCLQAGMDAYLVKPIRPAALLEAVEQLKPRIEPPPRLADAEPVEPDRATLLDEVGGDSQLLDEICELFARESASQMAAVRGAIESGDSAALARATHTLRSMLRSVRAVAADQMVATLQSLDPREQRDEALAVAERLAQAVGSLQERFSGTPDAFAADGVTPLLPPPPFRSHVDTATSPSADSPP
ncbi:MAG TPA: response regulator [Steroidobacteraceae bacterium]|nr:response regulator [Steroidobacteraceae bacterium]